MESMLDASSSASAFSFACPARCANAGSSPGSARSAFLTRVRGSLIARCRRERSERASPRRATASRIMNRRSWSAWASARMRASSAQRALAISAAALPSAFLSLGACAAAMPDVQGFRKVVSIVPVLL